MKRSCVNCRIEIDVPTLQTKYCPICKVIIAKQQRSTKKECDLFCLDCNASLPIGSKADKLYCNSCSRKRMIISHRKIYNRKKLDRFYKNLRINLIQTPYLIERNKIELVIKWL